MSVETNASATEAQTEAPAHGITLTEVAAGKVKQLLAKDRIYLVKEFTFNILSTEPTGLPFNIGIQTVE